MHCQAPSSHALVLDTLDRRLIDSYQRGLPVTARPFQRMAEQLGVSEAEVITRLERLQVAGVLSRIGPVFEHSLAGASLLAAVAVPDDELHAFAELFIVAPGVNFD